jgi:hypothetical protein
MVERFNTFDRLFEFNHVDPTLKNPQYDSLIRRTISTAQLDELDKCVLLCRTCHGLVHAQSISGRLELTVRLKETTATQSMRFQAVWDVVNRRLRVLTADEILVTPYRVRLGDAPAAVYFGTELFTEGMFTSQLRRLHEVTTILVQSLSNREAWLEVEHVDDRFYQMRFSTAFRLFKAELCETGPNDPVLWVRNGLALAKNGDLLTDHVVTCQCRYPD